MITMRGTTPISSGRKKDLYTITNLDRLHMGLGYNDPVQQDTRIRGNEQLIDWVLSPKRNGLVFL
jgi:hypothetical protein